MSLPTGAISMLDICTAYGRGGTGTTGFQNWKPYELGAYYRGGDYVPLYDPGGSNGQEPASQSNVDMNLMRGAGGFTHASTLVAGTRFDGKFYSYGFFGVGLYGASMTDRSVKCFARNILNLSTGVGGLLLQIDQTGNTLSGSGWYSLQVYSGGVNYTVIRTNSTFSQSGTIASWSWSSGFNAFASGTSYQIRIRLTSLY